MRHRFGGRLANLERREAKKIVAQRSIEILIGRLITDQGFRKMFCEEPVIALAVFMKTGHELTAIEIEALMETHTEFWILAANQIDPRLQKVRLGSAPH